MNENTKPIIGITMGDAAGISPELVAKLFDDPSNAQLARRVVIGDARVMSAAVEQFTKSRPKIHAIDTIAQAKFVDGQVDVLDLANLAPSDYELGRVNASCGKAFVEYIRVAAQLALKGEIDAITSAPTNKEAMHAAGQFYPGQTEVFGEETGSSDYFTILVGGPIRAFLMSSHVSLTEAISLVTQSRMESVLNHAVSALKDLWKIDDPLIAVAGLNPHAGDGGLFGMEEIENIIPVVEKFKQAGHRIVGPYPSDSMFLEADRGDYDGVVAMYHDQGVIPLKRHGYVTTIAGMPILRTTAGHGTAYNIAGRGIANPTVMAKAVELAAELAVRRKTCLAVDAGHG